MLSFVDPSGVTTPMPVTTTRRRGGTVISVSPFASRSMCGAISLHTRVDHACSASACSGVEVLGRAGDVEHRVHDGGRGDLSCR